MPEKVYTIGDAVRIYYPGGIIVRGYVVGVNDISVEDDTGKYFHTTKAYLVASGEMMQIVTAAFMSKVEKT